MSTENNTEGLRMEGNTLHRGSEDFSIISTANLDQLVIRGNTFTSPEDNDDQEEPDLYDAVAEYSRNHPTPAPTREEVTNKITNAVNTLQEMLDIAADTLEMNIEISLAAHTGHPKKRPFITIYHAKDIEP